jgi:hypothetical protein
MDREFCGESPRELSTASIAATRAFGQRLILRSAGVCAMRDKSWSDIVTAGCLIIVASVEALEQAISGAPRVAASLPQVSGLFHYVPLLLLIVAGISWLIGHGKKAPRPKPTSPVVEKTPQAPPWCDEMVAEDAKRTTERIVIVDSQPQLHLQEADPYIDFSVTFINATVFRIEAIKIEGESYYGRTPLAQHPRLLTSPDGRLTLYHAEKRILNIRQFLSKDVAGAIASTRGIVQLNFSRVSLHFKVLSTMPGAPETFSWCNFGDLHIAYRE